MKKMILWIVLGAVILVAIGVGVWLLLSNSEPELEGWVDCSVPMSEEQARICEKAEKQNYPYIAY